MKLRYNSPLILTYAFFSIGLFALDHLFFKSALTDRFFTVYPTFHFTSILDYFRLFSHIAGHSSWVHLISNMTFILLLGPLMEEKYGSGLLGEMIFMTGLLTGILNVLFFPAALRGASGVVFLLIILSSFTNIRGKEIPLTFILVALLFLSQEFIGIFKRDEISQFAHILGGGLGSIFGFVFSPQKNGTGVQ